MLRTRKHFLILASSSSNRIKILEKLNIPFNVFNPNINEKPLLKEKPATTVKRLSYLKAIKAREKYKENFILAADTIVYLRKKIINKTFNKNQAIKNLKNLSGRRHNVFTGLTLITNNNKVHYSTTKTMIKFKSLEEKEILKYMLTEEWKGCAGSYAIQGYAEAFIKYIMGSHSNVVGLPMHKVHNLAIKYNLYS